MAFYLFEPLGIDYISLVKNLVENAKNPKQFVDLDTNILTTKNI